jgi:hypothetical protein
MPDSAICPERATLESAVIVAIRNFYAVKPLDRGPVRRSALTAVKALQRHLEEHGCAQSEKLSLSGTRERGITTTP